MPRFKGRVVAIVEKQYPALVEIEAASREDAVAKVQAMYDQDELELDDGETDFDTGYIHTVEFEGDTPTDQKFFPNGVPQQTCDCGSMDCHSATICPHRQEQMLDTRYKLTPPESPITPLDQAGDTQKVWIAWNGDADDIIEYELSSAAEMDAFLEGVQASARNCGSIDDMLQFDSWDDVCKFMEDQRRPSDREHDTSWREAEDARKPVVGPNFCVMCQTNNCTCLETARAAPQMSGT